MSSMRNSSRPPAARARSKLSSAEKAWPTCRYPLGLGAKRKTACDMSHSTKDRPYHASDCGRFNEPAGSMVRPGLRGDSCLDAGHGVKGSIDNKPPAAAPIDTLWVPHLLPPPKILPVRCPTALRPT